MHLYEVLRRPLITEKNTVLQAQNKYVFEVAGGANKPQIKEAVEKAFKVKVKTVNVMTVPGKTRKMGRRLVDRLKAAREATSRPTYRIAATDPDVLYPQVVEELGVSFLFQGQPKIAILCFREALPVRSSRRLHHNLSLALLAEGQLDEAVREIRTATRLEPKNATSLAFQGFLLSLAGRSRDAVQAYERAIENDPTLVTARIELAWLLATSPDDSIRNGKRAVGLAESVLQLAGGRSVRGLDVVAAAYAEAGRFQDAAEAAEKALDLMRNERGPGRRSVAAPRNDTTAEAELQARLDLYRNGRPYRETTRSEVEEGTSH
jgi:large subunit ribosomal protein L23